jgi:uncharacterized protein
MNALISYTINQHHFILSPERVLFWENKKTLILADLHIGKTGHFRKSGIAVPQKVYREDLQRLFTLVLFFKAEQLIIVGDLSHSRQNKEMDLFKKWRNDFSLLTILLANGNHDHLENEWYRELNISRHDHLLMDQFSFLHDPEDAASALHPDHYAFCGHLHPAVQLRGRGKQNLQLPCFYFRAGYGILPAFSRFSGNSLIIPQAGEHVFAVSDKSLFQVQ